MTASLEGRSAVVTGGTRGIGLAIAAALGRAGARVAICGRDPAALDRALGVLGTSGTPARGRVCDVTDPAAVHAFAEWVRTDQPAPDILVNNAGLGRFAPFEELSLDDWETVMATNVRSLFLVTREFLPDMKRRGRGDVVNVVSLAGRNGFAGGTAYVTSKHAALGFSRALLMEARPAGIRVIAVCPGSVDTAFFENQQVLDPRRDRILRPEDVADTIVAALSLPPRATVSELDLRPANP
jgi:NAD(P)-dependent dehydrogenase (short-subunit alcohol dehydrogenase family)